jgi:hypothetical protein
MRVAIRQITLGTDPLNPKEIILKHTIASPAVILY